ncbi:hypothetical protein [Deinococcus humi]|uniref:Uncharacterized protein n=1 Tax=Deinococcus humi TaxID=662880 RepID=A0A7W8K018_9DEIO|nr:hypothetical protein [Deinococcus humi]MBB5366366.1 hypothetical protein [Deinococcus humi]
MPDPLTSEPLNFPLNFSHTVKANAKSNAQLLREGDYDAIERRVYADSQRCSGCGTDEKAKTLIVIRDRLTQGTFEIGRKCMEDLYSVDIGQFDLHAKQVRSSRIQLAHKLGLTGSLSAEQQIAIVREAVVTYLPVPERLTRELDDANPWHLEPAESDRIRDLHQLACYHREWQEEPERARRRWTALRGHPAFEYKPNRAEVHRLCSRALDSGPRLPERDILLLNALLRGAAGFEHKWPRLVDPQDHPDQEQYQRALQEALQARVQLGQPVDVQVTQSDARRFDPQDHAGLSAKRLYAVLAVWDADAEQYASTVETTDAYWKKTRRPFSAVGPIDRRSIPAETYMKRNDKNEMEEVVVSKAWTFQFRRVAWALAESYTETYPLWRAFSRTSLERYL